MGAARIAFDDEKLVVLVLHVGRVNAQAVQDGRLQKGLHLIAPLRQKDEQRCQNEEPHHVQHERLAGEPVRDEHNRPDDEQRESHDAQQFVQFGALLQERRKDAFKGGHTSGRLRVVVYGVGNAVGAFISLNVCPYC